LFEMTYKFYLFLVIPSLIFFFMFGPDFFYCYLFFNFIIQN
jgi:hypothetical protein